VNEDAFLHFAERSGDASSERDHLGIDPLCAPGSYDLGMDAVPHQCRVVARNEIENDHNVLIRHDKFASAHGNVRNYNAHRRLIVMYNCYNKMA
jgi:hypothetical protein